MLENFHFVNSAPNLTIAASYNDAFLFFSIDWTLSVPNFGQNYTSTIDLVTLQSFRVSGRAGVVDKFDKLAAKCIEISSLQKQENHYSVRTHVLSFEP